MFQIIASDLDGTLLNNAHLISEKTLQTIQKVEQQNITFSFATGRHHLDVLEIKKKFNLNSYMITSNGARIHDENNHLIYQKNLSTKVVFDILNYLNDKLADKENMIVHLYTDSGWYMDKKASTFDNHYKISNFNYQLFNFKKPPTDNIFKLLVTSENNDQETLNLIEKNLLKIFGQQCNIAFSTPTCLEIMDKEVSKGSALQYLAQKKGVCLKQTIAFGDGMNDLEMLSVAGKGLIMENAHERLKKALPNNEVIENNEVNGVANYIEKILEA